MQDIFSKPTASPDRFTSFFRPLPGFLILPVIAVYILWTGAVQTGLVSQIGYAAGYGRLGDSLLLSPRIHFSVPVGVYVFYASPGDQISVDYKISKESHGRLFFNLSRISTLLFDHSDYKSAGIPQKGEAAYGNVKLNVNKAGLYTVVIDPTSDGNGYDMFWTASWKFVRH